MYFILIYSVILSALLCNLVDLVLGAPWSSGRAYVSISVNDSSMDPANGSPMTPIRPSPLISSMSSVVRRSQEVVKVECSIVIAKSEFLLLASPKPQSPISVTCRPKLDI